MKFVFGREVIGDGVVIPMDVAEKSESVVGNIYEVRGKIKVSDASKITKDNVSVVESELYNRFNAKMKYLEITDDFIRLQVEGSPFAWEAFLLVLPSILKIIGIILVAVSVILIIPKAQWEVFMLIVGLILALGVGFDVLSGAKKVASEVVG